MKKIFFTILTISLVTSVTFAASNLFSDVPENAWYSNAVQTLSKRGIISGYKDGKFKPSKKVSRAEIAVMLDRLITSIESGLDENKVKICATTRKEQEKSEFVPGEILVVLPKDSDYSAILKEYGLMPDISEPLDDQTAVVSVKVPEGKEFEWICRLSQDNRIQYADPNSITSAD